LVYNKIDNAVLHHLSIAFGIIHYLSFIKPKSRLIFYINEYVAV
jgi:hypothetical protein